MVFEKNDMSPRMPLIKPLTKFFKNVKAQLGGLMTSYNVASQWAWCIHSFGL